MRVKKLLVIALLALPMMGMAQSSYEQIGESASITQFENKQNSAAYQQWLSQYEECGRQINAYLSSTSVRLRSVAIQRKRLSRLRWHL